MRKIGVKIPGIVLVLIIGIQYITYSQVAINSDGALPNASAMLEVTSTGKGFLPPRMTTAQRTSIATPATGLVVFDTDTKTNWYYNATGWCEVIERNNLGTTTLGTATDNTTIEADGTMKFNGNATVWNDLNVYPDATSRGSSNPPTWGGGSSTYFKNDGASSQGVFLWMFSSSTEQELYFTIQIPHPYKVGTTLYPHVHWTTKTGTPSGTNVVWGFEYTVVAIGGVFGNTTTITGNTVIASIGTPSGTGQHLITSLGTISGTGIGISTILVCRVFRKTADANDTFGNEVGFLGFDIHYEADTSGSRQEFIK
jgi:hypothetical protein